MLNRDSATPLYIQLAQLIRTDIDAGKLKAGDKLPSESQYAARYAIGRLTVREALSLLVNEGLLTKAHGKGTFVNAAKPAQPLRVDVLLDLNDRFFIPFYLEGITRVLCEYNANCVLHNTLNSEYEIAQLLSNIADSDTSGIILQPNPEDRTPSPALQAAFGKLASRNIPIMFIDTAYEGIDASYAIFDEKQAGKLAAQHFAQCGHRYLAMLGDDTRRDAFFRALGFENYFIEHGLIAPVIENAQDDIGAQLLRMLRQNPEITGIFCYNDVLAARAVQALNAQGLQVPSRISVIGCDDILIASSLYPQLTTIVHPKTTLSQHAARALLAIIDNKALAPLHKVFPPSLATRSTCAKI